MIDFAATAVDEIVVLGAHCDDVAIGMGGTLLTMAEARPGMRVQGLVLSGGGTRRAAEEQAALEAFCPGADLELTILDIPDGRAPAHWNTVKDQLKALAASSEPQLVFGPQRGDAHQDHRLLAELAPTEFRDHVVLGYEILKWETDTVRPNVFHPLRLDVAEEKARLLLKHYPSQSGRDWFDEQAFLAVSRLRGVQCRHPHAEGFIAEKTIVSFTGARRRVS